MVAVAVAALVLLWPLVGVMGRLVLSGVALVVLVLAVVHFDGVEVGMLWCAC